MLAYNLSFKELKNATDKLAILPVGSLEQHGPFLPLGTDSITAERATLALEKKMSSQVVIYPTLYYGCSKEHKNFPGTVYLEYDTYLKVILEIFRSIFAAGFKKLLVIGGHGGNDQILKVAQSNWNYDHEDQKVYYQFAFTENVKDKGVELLGSMESHAGSVETSLIYSLSEEYVKIKKKQVNNPEFKRKPGKSLSLHRSDEISKVGVISSTKTLTIDPQIGKQIFETMVSDLTEYAKKLI